MFEKLEELVFVCEG